MREYSFEYRLKGPAASIIGHEKGMKNNINGELLLQPSTSNICIEANGLGNSREVAINSWTAGNVSALKSRATGPFCSVEDSLHSLNSQLQGLPSLFSLISPFRVEPIPS